MDKMRQSIDSIIVGKKYCNTITSELELSHDLGFDSLDLVELVVDLEEHFGIEIAESDLDPSALRTVGQVYSIVAKYLEESYAIRVFEKQDA